MKALLAQKAKSARIRNFSKRTTSLFVGGVSRIHSRLEGKVSSTPSTNVALSAWRGARLVCLSSSVPTPLTPGLSLRMGHASLRRG